MSSINDFLLKSLFFFFFFQNYSIRKCSRSGIRLTTLSYDSKKKKKKKIKAKPYRLAYNLISAFVVSESSLKHILCTVQTT